MEELEVLESIYLDDLKIERTHSGSPLGIQLLLHPATGDELDKRYVCITLTLRLSEQYPDEVPEIIITNPRGIADEEVQSLLQELEKLADEKAGGEMLYEIIELAKESLTDGNVPYCPCTICCEHFTEEDLFTKTDCYHYFHNDCLRRYIEHQLDILRLEKESKVQHEQANKENEKIKCPVCREEITYEQEFFESETADHVKDEIKYLPSEGMKAWQKEMAELYCKQKDKGGIIDVEAEKNRYLLTDSDGDIPIIVNNINTAVNNDDKKYKSLDEKDITKIKQSDSFTFNYSSKGRGKDDRETFTKERRQNDRFSKDYRGHRSPRDYYPRQGFADKQRNYYDKRPLSGHNDRRGFHRGDNSKNPKNHSKTKTESKKNEEGVDKAVSTNKQANETVEKQDSNSGLANYLKEQGKTKPNDLNVKSSTELSSPNCDIKKKIDSGEGDNLSEKMAACDVKMTEDKSAKSEDDKTKNSRDESIKNHYYDNRRYRGRGQRRHAGENMSSEVKSHGRSSESINHGYYRNRGDYHNHRQNRFHDDQDKYGGGHKRYENSEKGHKRGQNYHDRRQDHGQQERTKGKIVCDKESESNIKVRTDRDHLSDKESDDKKKKTGVISTTHSRIQEDRTSNERREVKSINSSETQCEINGIEKPNLPHKHDSGGKSEKINKPPGFVIKGPPPGFSEKSIKPPPGF